MINYTEKGYGLHLAISKAGHWLENRDGQWVSDNDVAVQGIIDAYTLLETQNYIISQIDKHSKLLRDKATNGISAAEMCSWPIKRAEAGKSGTVLAADAPILSAEATARGVALSVLVDKVRTKSNALSLLEATIAGNSGKHADAILAKATFYDALTYDWSTGWPVV